jgi:NADH-quinone oxidoreductase E subunit
VTAIASPFTPEQQKIFDAESAKIFPKYPADRRAAALIPVLHLAQKLHGWLKPEAMEYVGFVVGVPATRVREVVTFYTMFHLKPVGKTHVQVCVNLTCWLKGSDQLVDVCRQEIGERQFEPTADGQKSWCEVECLAACGTAPAAMINDDYHENFTVAELQSALRK